MPWITVEDVAAEVGIPSTSDAWLADATAAANDWCFRRRAVAGYSDDPDVVPNASVRAGTILFAADQYRRRGATDGASSFDAWPEPPTPALTGLTNIYRLLGVNRPVVA